MYGFCNVWVCVCVGFVMCGCVYVWVLYNVGVCMYGFCNVWVYVFLARKQVCVLHHPPYSPELFPCGYFLFLKLKLPLKGRLFEDVQDIQAAVTSSLRAIPQKDVQMSFQSLLDRATRCIDAEGMYFE